MCDAGDAERSEEERTGSKLGVHVVLRAPEGECEPYSSHCADGAESGIDTSTHLADPGTRQFKRRQSAIAVIALVAVCAWQYFGAPVRPSTGALLFVAAVMGIAVAFTLNRMYWRLADAVSIDGSVLTVRRGNIQIHVNNAEIIGVRSIPFALRRAIAIELRDAHPPFGSRIVFLPLGWKHLDAQETDALVTLLHSRLNIGRST